MREARSAIAGVGLKVNEGSPNGSCRSRGHSANADRVGLPGAPSGKGMEKTSFGPEIIVAGQLSEADLKRAKISFALTKIPKDE